MCACAAKAKGFSVLIMKETILCFGDSNTHGTPPMVSRDHHPRFDRRWPVVMAEILGCELIEDGLPGRTACQLIATSADVHLDGLLGLRIALASQGPIDRLVIMLGTNDLQNRHGKTAAQIASGIAALLSHAHMDETQARHDGFSTLLIAPPPVVEVGTFVPEFLGGAVKAAELAPLLRELAAAWGADFLDAGAHMAVDSVDGTHFDEAGHEALGVAVARVLG